MKIFVHMPCAFNAFYGCLRTSSFHSLDFTNVDDVFEGCKKEAKAKKNSIQSKEKNVTYFCCSVIVPQGKFLLSLRLISPFLFLFGCALSEGDGGDVFVLPWKHGCRLPSTSQKTFLYVLCF